MKNKGHQSGFTLIELIATLILVGVIGVTLGLGITQIMNGFLFSKKNAEVARKAQLAMTRLVKELKDGKNFSSSSETSITFTGDATYNIAWIPGNPLTMNGETLTDDVSDFKLAYYDSYNSSSQTTYSASTALIGITLKLKGANDMILTFENRVLVRK